MFSTVLTQEFMKERNAELDRERQAEFYRRYWMCRYARGVLAQAALLDAVRMYAREFQGGETS